MAFCPMGVDPPGVIIVGVILGVVPPGVMLGVAPGVSSHLERRLLADGVGVSDTILSPGCTERGVSAHPAWAGVSLSVRESRPICSFSCWLLELQLHVLESLIHFSPS